MEAAAAGKQAVKLISGKVSDEVRKNYYRSAMEDIFGITISRAFIWQRSM